MVLPYKDSGKNKKEQVATMFDNIAHKYDFLNHFLSMGIDKIWRRKAISILGTYQPQQILDIATGTGDFAIASLAVKPKRIVGIDISESMLAVGVEKIKLKGVQNTIELQKGDSENIQFENATFDAATCAFGVRNFENLGKGLTEIFRVLSNNAVVVILEFSKPRKFPMKQIFGFYFKYILPFIGRMFSKDASAYTYLPESVREFPDGELFLAELSKAGFVNNKAKQLAFGIATIYIGEKQV